MQIGSNRMKLGSLSHSFPPLSGFLFPTYIYKLIKNPAIILSPFYFRKLLYHNCIGLISTTVIPRWDTEEDLESSAGTELQWDSRASMAKPIWSSLRARHWAQSPPPTATWYVHFQPLESLCDSTVYLH